MTNMKGDKGFKVDFMCIGAAKSGTTWLAENLVRHPSVCISEPKEVHYFNRCKAFAKKKNQNFGKSLAWYEKHFKHCKRGQVKGECTTNYLWDKNAPYLIKKNFHNVKLIVCLRNPADRAYSHYWMRKSYIESEKGSFEEAITKEKMYLEVGYYYKHLKRYLKYFDRKQILVIWFEDIKNDPNIVLKSVLKFIGVNKNLSYNPKEKFHEAKAVKLKFVIPLMRLTSNLLINLGLSKVLHITKKIGLKKAIMKLNTSPIKYPDINPATRNLLRKKFKYDIKKLERLLNKDLSHWK